MDRSDDPPRPPVDTGGSRLKVLDLGRFLAGPVTATLLGDLGAEVIKVERPTLGDVARHVPPQVPDDPGMSYEFQIEGRNKRSITLDFTVSEGQHLLRRLVEWADVLVENFQPGKMAQWGLGYDDLQAVNPRLVYVSVSGFGQTGPYGSQPSYDFVASAFGGLTDMTGMPDGPPVMTGFAVADLVTPAFAAMGALEAIRRRDVPGGTGRGSWVDIGLYEAILRLATPWIALYEREGVERPRETSVPPPDGRRPLSIWGYVYGTGDSRYVAALPYQREDEAHRTLMATIGRPDLADDPALATLRGRTANFRVLDEALRTYCGERPAEEVLSVLRAVGAACGPVNSVADIVADPHIRSRNLVTVPDHRGNPITMQGPVPRLTSDGWAGGATSSDGAGGGHGGDVRWAGEELGASNVDVYCGLLDLSRDELSGSGRRAWSDVAAGPGPIRPPQLVLQEKVTNMASGDVILPTSTHDPVWRGEQWVH